MDVGALVAKLMPLVGDPAANGGAILGDLLANHRVVEKLARVLLLQRAPVLGGDHQDLDDAPEEVVGVRVAVRLLHR